ncbi:hypothetical protein FKP32DRAFT_528020 [Trametes sanguinea]|nr:hypothetical protein FKP32DRAFT_528020 [Trametes sanguinea]
MGRSPVPPPDGETRFSVRRACARYPRAAAFVRNAAVSGARWAYSAVRRRRCPGPIRTWALASVSLPVSNPRVLDTRVSLPRSAPRAFVLQCSAEARRAWLTYPCIIGGWTQCSTMPGSFNHGTQRHVPALTPPARCSNASLRSISSARLFAQVVCSGTSESPCSCECDARASRVYWLVVIEE